MCCTYLTDSDRSPSDERMSRRRARDCSGSVQCDLATSRVAQEEASASAHACSARRPQVRASTARPILPGTRQNCWRGVTSDGLKRLNGQVPSEFAVGATEQALENRKPHFFVRRVECAAGLQKTENSVGRGFLVAVDGLDDRSKVFDGARLAHHNSRGHEPSEQAQIRPVASQEEPRYVPECVAVLKPQASR